MATVSRLKVTTAQPVLSPPPRCLAGSEERTAWGGQPPPPTAWKRGGAGLPADTSFQTPEMSVGVREREQTDPRRFGTA